MKQRPPSLPASFPQLFMSDAHFLHSSSQTCLNSFAPVTFSFLCLADVYGSSRNLRQWQETAGRVANVSVAVAQASLFAINFHSNCRYRALLNKTAYVYEKRAHPLTALRVKRTLDHITIWYNMPSCWITRTRLYLDYLYCRVYFPECCAPKASSFSAFPCNIENSQMQRDN